MPLKICQSSASSNSKEPRAGANLRFCDFDRSLRACRASSGARILSHIRLVKAWRVPNFHGALLQYTNHCRALPRLARLPHHSVWRRLCAGESDQGRLPLRCMTSCAFMGARAQPSRCESFAGIIKHPTNAGLTDVQVFGDDVPQWDILQKHPWSLPILARRPKGVNS